MSQITLATKLGKREKSYFLVFLSFFAVFVDLSPQNCKKKHTCPLYLCSKFQRPKETEEQKSLAKNGRIPLQAVQGLFLV